jgi:hypothetical protein
MIVQRKTTNQRWKAVGLKPFDHISGSFLDIFSDMLPLSGGFY